MTNPTPTERSYITGTATTTFTGTGRDCKHNTGWFFTVHCFLHDKRMFWCDLCHSALDMKQYNRIGKENK